jgi:hypothetical protein
MFPFRCFFVSAFLLGLVRADEIALVKIGDEWRYRPVLEEALGTAEDWREIDFDDRGWLSGPSGFSIGYGTDEATLLPWLPVNYTSVRFRRSFEVADPGGIAWLILRADFTDGFVAYLNGREIARRNIGGASGGFVDPGQLATEAHVRYSTEEMVVAMRSGLVVPGRNVLAIQLHRAMPLAAGLFMSAELMANFNRAPYIQNTSSNRASIVWKTPLPSKTRVDFGLTPEFGSAFLGSDLVTTHVATLTNLTPDTVYYYQASSAGDGWAARGPVETFRTFKSAGPVRFLAAGDNGWNSVPQYILASLMDGTAADLVLNTGDAVYPTFTAQLADQRCFSVYQPQMGRIPFFYSLGNHDLNPSSDAYLEVFHLPTNSVSLAAHAAARTSPEHYYSFDHGDVHFVALFVPFIFQHRVMEGDPQHSWLANDLATTRKPWKVVFFHVPMHSSSLHRRDDYNYNGIPD